MRVSLAWLLASTSLLQPRLSGQISTMLESADPHLGLVISSVGRLRVEGRERAIEYLELFRGASNGPKAVALDGASLFVNGGLAGVVPTDTKLTRGESLYLVFSEEDRRAIDEAMDAPCVVCIAGAGKRLLTSDGFVEVRTSRGARIDAIAWGAGGGKPDDVAAASRLSRPETALMDDDGTWALHRCTPAARPIVGAARWEIRPGPPPARPKELSPLGMVQGVVSSEDGKPIADAVVTLVGDGHLARSTSSKQDGSFAFRRVVVGKVEIRVDIKDHTGVVWSGDLDTASPLVVHLECQRSVDAPSTEATFGPDGGSLRDPGGRWRLDVPSGALVGEVRFRVCRRVSLVRVDQDWGSTDVAAPLRVFLGGAEIVADSSAVLAKPVRFWFAVDGELANARNRGDVIFEVSKLPGGPGIAQSGNWAADGDAWGVAADIATLGTVAACHQPTTDDGVPLAVRDLGMTMDANWDGAIDLLDSPAIYTNVAPGDIVTIHGRVDCAMRFESAVPGGGGPDERFLAELLRSQTVHLSSFGRGGRLGANRSRAEYPFRLECAGNSLGGAKNEVGAFTVFRVVKVSQQVPSAPHGEGKALGVVLVASGVGAVVTTRR